MRGSGEGGFKCRAFRHDRAVPALDACSSVMRRNLVTLPGESIRRGVLNLLAQGAHGLLQAVYLLLLPKHGAVERVQEVFRKADFSLEFVYFGLHHAFPAAAAASPEFSL
jgi:hypothetical protein